VIAQQELTDFNLYTYLAVTGAILLLSLALLVIAYAEKHYGRPEDEIERKPKVPHAEGAQS
jgi:hypothetical protein